MSCYYPMVALKDSFRSKHGDVINIRKYRFVGKLENLGKWEDIKRDYSEFDPILLPCGNCKGCRLDQSRTWADRMCLEFDHTKKAVFLTLTYDNDHLRVNKFGVPTLVKSDLSTFMKDLRGNKYYENKQIRFYGCGEYGDRFGRPHMHVILFGVDLSDFTDGGFIGSFQVPEFFLGRNDHKLYYAGQNELKQIYYRSPHLDNIVWKKGRVCITEFSWKSAAYVARYVRKKLKGELEYLYDDYDLQAPFALMSRKPGLAGYFMDDHPEKDFFEENKFSFNGKVRPIPNYLFDKLEKENYLVYHAIKKQRKQFAEDNMLLKLQQTDLSFEEQLEVDRIHTENITKQLVRNLE